MKRHPKTRGTCELYCNPPRHAEWEQCGWWPDFVCCHECRQLWDERCKSSGRCAEFAEWRPWTGTRHAYTAKW